MTYYYSYEDESPSVWRKAAVGAGVIAALLAAYAGYSQLAGSSGSGAPAPVLADGDDDSAPASSAPASTPTSTLPASDSDAGATAQTPPASNSAAAEQAERGADERLPSRPPSVRVATTTVATGAATDEVEPASTLPDGSPTPVVAIFDVDTITLAGAVPTQAAADRLATLAAANSKTPASIINLLEIDPSVPNTVGVRVVELTSSRFPTASAEIRAEHAAELDRMVAVMNALPNTTVLVVGHADQVGDENSNFQLSERRALAVVTYMVGQGIDSGRLSARAVGESDLLSVNDDATSLALNRRTEFIISGVLVES